VHTFPRDLVSPLSTIKACPEVWKQIITHREAMICNVRLVSFTLHLSPPADMISLMRLHYTFSCSSLRSRRSASRTKSRSSFNSWHPPGMSIRGRAKNRDSRFLYSDKSVFRFKRCLFGGIRRVVKGSSRPYLLELFRDRTQMHPSLKLPSLRAPPGSRCLPVGSGETGPSRVRGARESRMER